MLRARDVPVVIHEAGNYPRHRICGEFLCGRGPEVIHQLGAEELLKQALPARDCAWFGPKGLFYKTSLPVAALSLSRHVLDAGLASLFSARGGELITSSRMQPDPLVEGQVLACGRNASGPHWVGVKQHYDGLLTTSDLEMHCGRGGYIGLCRIHGDRVNVCGLFRSPLSGRAESRSQLPLEFARAVGLTDLAQRLDQAVPVTGTLSGVSRLRFGHTGQPGFSIGDAFAQIPPFSGNGMSMALEAGILAAPTFAAYSAQRLSWNQACAEAYGRLRRAFRLRLTVARLIHPFLWHPAASGIAPIMARSRCLPFLPVLRLTR